MISSLQVGVAARRLRQAHRCDLPEAVQGLVHDVVPGIREVAGDPPC